MNKLNYVDLKRIIDALGHKQSIIYKEINDTDDEDTKGQLKCEMKALTHLKMKVQDALPTAEEWLADGRAWITKTEKGYIFGHQVDTGSIEDGTFSTRQLALVKLQRSIENYLNTPTVHN